MTTYVITVPDDTNLGRTDPYIVLCQLAERFFGEDVASHAMYHHDDHVTGDETVQHQRLGITVRKLR